MNAMMRVKLKRADPFDSDIWGGSTPDPRLAIRRACDRVVR